MIEHTNDKRAYAAVDERDALLMARPEQTERKSYRKPIPIKLKFSSKKKANFCRSVSQHENREATMSEVRGNLLILVAAVFAYLSFSGSMIIECSNGGGEWKVYYCQELLEAH